MGMLGPKCPKCWERFENCTCCSDISRCSNCLFPLNACICKSKSTSKKLEYDLEDAAPKKNVLGQITPVKAYQTSDGRKFVGPDALEKAEDHQRWLNRQDTTPKKEPRKTPLKKRKIKRRKT